MCMLGVTSGAVTGYQSSNVCMIVVNSGAVTGYQSQVARMGILLRNVMIFTEVSFPYN